MTPVARIIPAYAGSTHTTPTRHARQRDHPRIRGEHRDGVAAPRTSARIIPAYAGSTRPRHAPARRRQDHPRIRGEHPSSEFETYHDGGSSPHTRGARWLGDWLADAGRIIPAYAGSTWVAACEVLRFEDHPRIRGEHAVARHLKKSPQGSSPHTRGAHHVSRGGLTRGGIIPAYAGSTTAAGVPSATAWDHPRIRGEHWLGGPTWRRYAGSSPHTRGARPQMFVDTIRGRIIPAYAGSTPTSPTDSRAMTDHPRIRGEHDCSIYFTNFPTGSSPHTRGAPACATSARKPGRIIPAYAGSTIFLHHHEIISWDHPRIRGEHLALGAILRQERGSSPHTRGALGAWRPRPWSPGIIPAYAGSTDATYPFGLWYPDHPRIRGEHATVQVAAVKCAGSSPHTRGAPSSCTTTKSSRGIIPAYAGSTLRLRDLRAQGQDHPRIRGEHRPRGFRSAPGPGSSPHTRGARRRRGGFGPD